MPEILGKNVIIVQYDNVTSTWKPYACADSCSLNVTTDFVETSIKNSGKSYTFLPTRNSFTAKVSGLIVLQMAGTEALPDLRAKQLNGDLLKIRYQREDLVGNIYTDEGFVYVSSTDDSGGVDDLAKFNIDLKGSGSLTQLFTPTPIISGYMRYDYSGSGGEYGFTNSAFIGKTLIEFVKDGVGFGPIITSGTPIDKQVLFDNTTGQIRCVIPFSVFEPAYVIYQN